MFPGENVISTGEVRSIISIILSGHLLTGQLGPGIHDSGHVPPPSGQLPAAEVDHLTALKAALTMGECQWIAGKLD